VQGKILSNLRSSPDSTSQQQFDLEKPLDIPTPGHCLPYTVELQALALQAFRAPGKIGEMELEPKVRVVIKHKRNRGPHWRLSQKFGCLRSGTGFHSVVSADGKVVVAPKNLLHTSPVLTVRPCILKQVVLGIWHVRDKGSHRKHVGKGGHVDLNLSITWLLVRPFLETEINRSAAGRNLEL
jgi:hypothetical protein